MVIQNINFSSNIETVFHTLKNNIPYEELILSIDKLLTKYEKDIDKTIKQKISNAEKRIENVKQIWQQNIIKKNNSYPEWYNVKPIPSIMSEEKL